MPAVAVHGSLGAQPMSSPSIEGQRPPLRRAVYVHVSDLTSAYNIDHAKLAGELERVKADQLKNVESSANSRFSVPTELDTSPSQKRLQPPKCGYNLCVLVGGIQVVVDKYRVDRSRVRLAEVQVGDETGIVSMRARDDQIDVLQEISDRSGAVVLRNCTVELYQGKHMRLSVSKWGKICPYPDEIASTPAQPSKMNQERNYSLIDLSVVATELIESRYQAKDGLHSKTGSSTSGLGGYAQQNQNRRNNRKNNYSGPQQIQAMQYGRTANPGQLMYSLGGPGYGMYEGMDNQAFSAWPRQPQPMPQQMMHQQQAFQHQMQQHYQGSQADQRRAMQASSPMLSPGIPSSGAFDASTSGLSPSFILSPAAQLQGTPVQFGNRPGSPSQPGRMNPQAATFDPSLGAHQHQPH